MTRGSATSESGTAVVPAVGGASAAAERLEREARSLLAEALDQGATLHEPGQRERYRSLLERALEQAGLALAAAEETRGASENGGVESERAPIHATVTAARATLATASAAKAQDALHGAGQLSLSAQRAPTSEACDDGWRRVEAIVRGAEASARIAATSAAALEHDEPKSAVARRALAAAHQAGAAARAARRIFEDRNHAYTFHADSRFSFGEGWYLAAAAVLAGVAVQIEPGKDQTAQAEKFLLDAGLGSKLRPYRSRPRAMKHVTAIVGRAFRADPALAQRTLRAAFLGEAPIPSTVADWLDQRLRSLRAGDAAGKKVLLWIRDGVHHPGRNTRWSELVELVARVQGAGLVPVLTGDAIRESPVPEGAVDMILFWKDPVFRQADMRRAQLQFFEHLRLRHGLVGQVGVTTAGMDGPALMGLPTLYLTEAPNVRMREWVGAVPGYEEVVRVDGYLERISRVLEQWAGTA